MSVAVYMTADEVTAVLAHATTPALPSTDPRRAAWAALADAGDRFAAIQSATADIDACLWNGRREDPEQELEWPRIDRITLALIEPDPNAAGTETVAGLPARLRAAFAIQCAHHALRQRGLDAMKRIEDAAQRGVTSFGGARSEAIDLVTARQPESRLAPEALRLIARYLAAGAHAA